MLRDSRQKEKFLLPSAHPRPRTLHMPLLPPPLPPPPPPPPPHLPPPPPQHPPPPPPPPPPPWPPLPDEEWEPLAPSLAAHGCGLSFAPRPGRPPEDTRARLDAIFRAVTLKAPGGGRGTWKQLPEAFGKPDTVSRTYRRWARANLWARLLAEVACPTCPPILRRLTYFICCA